MLGKLALALPPPPRCEVNLTSLVDVSLMVVMYLLMVFATSTSDARPLSDIVLPESSATGTVLPTVKISISPSALRVGNQLVLPLSAGQLGASDDDGAKRIMPLFHALQRERLRLVSGVQSLGEMNLEKQSAGLIYLEATKGLPYGMIDRVLKTATAAGFDKFRLVVSHKQ